MWKFSKYWEIPKSGGPRDPLNLSDQSHILHSTYLYPRGQDRGLSLLIFKLMSFPNHAGKHWNTVNYCKMLPGPGPWLVPGSGSLHRSHPGTGGSLPWDNQALPYCSQTGYNVWAPPHHKVCISRLGTGSWHPWPPWGICPSWTSLAIGMCHWLLCRYSTVVGVTCQCTECIAGITCQCTYSATNRDFSN